MRTIQISDFKKMCSSLLDHLDADGFVITKHGKPIAQVMPFEQKCSSLIGVLKAKITVKGDIMSASAQWDAQS